MKNYKTTDIILAACLRLYGFQMINIELNGSKGVFCFDDVSDDVLTEYDLGNCRVEPVMFNNAIKQLTTSVRRMIRS